MPALLCDAEIPMPWWSEHLLGVIWCDLVDAAADLPAPCSPSRGRVASRVVMSFDEVELVREIAEYLCDSFFVDVEVSVELDDPCFVVHFESAVSNAGGDVSALVHAVIDAALMVSYRRVGL